MDLFRKFSIQALVLACIGGACGYWLGPRLPTTTAAELVQALANVTAIAGSILGFSVSWLAQSRTLIKGIDYDAAGETFTSLGIVQHELLWRWGVALGCSITAVVGAVFLKHPQLAVDVFLFALTATSCLVAVALGYVVLLFLEMLRISKLKSKLDEHERAELRKTLNTPERTNRT